MRQNACISKHVTCTWLALRTVSAQTLKRPYRPNASEARRRRAELLMKKLLEFKESGGRVVSSDVMGLQDSSSARSVWLHEMTATCSIWSQQHGLEGLLAGL